ncbi:hypothetical protein A3K69_06770 [Candidatus Bathyarchaeota archaeon RBG_16_57_9]|nr:MAG: hypothetical protein A3K69_06770 [Candidatus Bathyarchaeota archaeon RBG_16_57_9]
MKSSKPVGFSATIYKIVINPAVDIPEDVSRAFGKRGYVPVKGSLNGTPIRATLVPVGGGRHRFYINTEMRRRAKVDTGDKVQLILDNDTEPRIFPCLRSSLKHSTMIRKLRTSGMSCRNRKETRFLLT